MRSLVLALLVVASAAAQADPVPPQVRAHAVRRSGSISIDGNLDEAAWQSAPKQSGFVQRFPKDGAKANSETSWAILYDDDAIYVGVWADDPEPDKIRALLTRRDVDALADAVVLGFDSYHDRRTAYCFQLNAAGVQRDFMLFDDQNQDDSWDAVWTGNAAITAKGWTAEFRIPLSQLRFPDDDQQQWGFQILRVVARTLEQSTWSPWPRSTPQVVSKFGIVDGIDHLPPARRLELLPYVTGGVGVEPIDAGDPLNDHVAARRNLGLDLKYGLGPAFTLSATINPDFGQVEADPSQVNLSANQLFFAEKRPFFIEGVDLFKLPIGNGDNNPETAFYSRRIGAAPDAPDTDYAFIHAPDSVPIYGATKLTGKTRDGWSIGVLDAVTGRESAAIVDDAGTRMDPVVAPLTNYAVGRVKRDFRDGGTTVGASATAVDRALSGTPLAMKLHDQAYTGGLQIQHRWDENRYSLDIHGVGSYVHGTEEAIANTQKLNWHLWQRPDAKDVHFDPTRTSMEGMGLTWRVGKMGDAAHWRWMSGGDLRSPGLELNDAGFQNASDRIIPFIWGQYHDNEPTDDVLNWSANADVFTVTNFEPRALTYGIESFIQAQLASYWNVYAGVNGQTAGWDPVALRGGPTLRSTPNLNGFMGISTDTRRRVRIDFNGNGGRDWVADGVWGGIDVGATIQARSNIDIFLGPSWFERDEPLQYVDQVADASGRTHYVFARIHQTVTSLTMRVNWTFSPHLSLQGYAQPFIASGEYSQLKDVDHPDATRFGDRFHVLEGNEYAVMDGRVYVNHNGSYAFDKPDFDIRQLRSTLVVRWEYRPGSSVFAIWSHGRTSSADDGHYRLGHDLSSLASADGENIVMIKANYWIGL